MLVLAVADALEVRSRAIGLVGVLVAVAFGTAGPVAFGVLRRGVPR